MKKKIAVAAILVFAALSNVYILSVSLLDDSILKQMILCIAIDILAVICIFNIKELLKVPLDIYTDKKMFWTLAKNDFQAKFAGSTLGIFWAFAQPFITVLLYWFVFQVGLRAGGVSNHPFILFLISGLIPWFYFSEAWSGATNSLLEYSYLVKKMLFNVGILPVLKIVSSLFVHLFFVTLAVMLCTVYGYGIDLYLVQLLYYVLATAFLAVGLGYISSCLTVFFKDISQIVNIMLTVGVWLTPIMWNADATLSGTLHVLFKRNPVYYIVSGYRDCLLSKVWFWEKPVWSVYFWVVSILIYLIGVKMFNKLKIHFSDVL